MQPVNPKLDTIVYRCLRDAVSEITKHNRIVFEYSEKGVPETGKAIHAMWEQAKYANVPFKVFSGANAAENLYFSPKVNLLYRAVHDVDHALAYSVGRGTTKFEDEVYLNCLMAKRVHDWCLNCDMYTEADALAAFFAVYHDTVGQVHYYRDNGEFCTDQRDNTIRLMDACNGVAFLKHGTIASARQVMIGMLKECGE